MAKLCSPYGTSPVTSFFNELTSNSFSDEFHQIRPDPFDFLEDMPSIYSDIQRIESSDIFTSCGDLYMDLEVKPEVCNNDLMWSCVPPSEILSTSFSSSCSSDIDNVIPISELIIKSESDSIKDEEEQEQKPPTVVIAKKLNEVKQEIEIKQEPIDDVEQQLQHHSIRNSRTLPKTPMLASSPITTQFPTQTMRSIPAGTSLLRRSNQILLQQQQQQKLQQTMRGTLQITKCDQLLNSAVHIPTTNNNNYNKNNNKASTVTTISRPMSSAILNSSFCSNSSKYQRPDTPHSLDDDCSTPEFKHNVDLRACVMGSNNISLTSDPTHFINNVSQELQDTSKKQIDTRLITNCSLTDVLDVINNSSMQDSSLLTPSISSASTCSSGFNYLSVNTSGSIRSTDYESDEESTVSSSTCVLSEHDITYGAGGVSPVSSQSSDLSTSSRTHHYMHHSDHSYTRCKDGMDDLSTNLETPSDSEEEIDVVSINDKKLPTNPSDKDRRALQTKVAHKFNSARIVKTPSGIRTIPPRRRGSYDLPYTPVTSSPVKSVNNSRFPSPTVTPYQNQYTTKYVQQQQQMMTVVLTDSTTGVPLNILSASDKSRKRLLANSAATATNNATIINGAEIAGLATMPPAKKHRGKKTKHLVTAVQLPNGVLKRHFSVDETADTIEKRNLHNDMERQRRIGLKNLFESLKKQIPSIRDKERAPKVNILREAAKLCESLTREDQQLIEQKAKLEDEIRQKQLLLSQLQAQQIN